MKLEVVPVDYIHVIWPTVESLLAPAYKLGVNEYTLDQTKLLIMNGQWVLTVITVGDKIQGAMVLNTYNRPNDRVTFIQAIGGRNSVNDEIMRQLKEYSARVGSTAIECAARPSMVRLLGKVGMEAKYTILEVPNYADN